MKIAILDDEMHGVESLVLHIHQIFPEASIVYKSTKPLEALNVLKRLEVDLLFLDVEMPVLNGFEFLKKFGEIPFDVIFTTAYSQYALEAFKAQAVNYLLKPIDADELKASMEQYLRKMPRKTDYATAEIDSLLATLKRNGILKNKIAIPTLDGLEFIEISQIVYCQAQSNYTNIVTLEGTIMISRTLKEVEKILSKFSFIRVHQSYLINPNFLERYHRGDGGYVVLADEYRIPISQSKRQRVVEIFKGLKETF